MQEEPGNDARHRPQTQDREHERFQSNHLTQRLILLPFKRKVHEECCAFSLFTLNGDLSIMTLDDFSGNE